jgi:hypothetical protein
MPQSGKLSNFAALPTIDTYKVAGPPNAMGAAQEPLLPSTIGNSKLGVFPLTTRGWAELELGDELPLNLVLLLFPL